MKKQLKQIEEFHEKFTKTLTNEQIKQIRVKLMQEELNEVKEAAEKDDITNLAKELADLLYILLGTVRVYGLSHKFEAIFDEVHLSNMSKVDDDGNPVLVNGKPVKGKNYKPADIDKILNGR